MCRSIKTLRGIDPPPDNTDFHAAALQYVRKISGYREPSAANRDEFEHAVEDIAEISERLLANLVVRKAS